MYVSYNRFFRFYHYDDDDNSGTTTGLYKRTTADIAESFGGGQCSDRGKERDVYK